MTTKDRIWDEALTLFAENGYDGTVIMESIEKYIRHFCDVYMTD